ncbi:hypothetical protein D3C72_1941720 [compost metagenome]
MLEKAGKDSGHPLYPLVHMFTASETGPTPLLEMFFQGRMPRFDCRETFEGLAGDLVCPPQEALLETAFAYFVRSGFLAAPIPGGALERR